MATNTHIIIAGKRYDIGHPVKTWEDKGGYNAYLPHNSKDETIIHPTHPAKYLEKVEKRYRDRRGMGRDRTLARLQKICRQVVVHLDGCNTAYDCYRVLHDQRGLSAHFLCDNDGTIYQTLDVIECAFHAGLVNEISVGIELQNKGDAGRFGADFYQKHNLPARQTVTCRIHGHQILAYDFTEPQYEGMIKLGAVLARVLRIPLASPRAGTGDLLWSPMDEPRRFSGFVGHYHLTKNKWDPGPFDWPRLFRNIGARVSFPLSPPRKDQQREPAKKADKRFAAELATSYEASEKSVAAHFPLGPLGRSRLWHGGVHLPAKEGTPIYAPIQGRAVLAKFGAECPVGSCNFVLLRHRLQTRARALDFWTLYYHLQPDDAVWGRKPPPWMARNPVEVRRMQRGKLALLDDGVDNGELLGFVGLAGPRAKRKGQIHFAVLSVEELGKHADPGYWDVVVGARQSRLCRNRSLIERVDRPQGGKPRDGMLSRRELRNFYSFDSKREELHNLVVRYRAEWTPGGWDSELGRAPDFAALSATQRRELIAQQIKPTLWWTKRAAAHAGLPADGFVYAYHPLGFLDWYRKLLRKQAKMRASALGAASTWKGKRAPKHLTVDAESVEDMSTKEDIVAGKKTAQKVTLEDIAAGYTDE